MSDRYFGSPRIACKCGRMIPLEQGLPKKHRVGKNHPAFPGIVRAKRNVTWCPEPEAAAEAHKKAVEMEEAAKKAEEAAKKAEEAAKDGKEESGEEA